MTRAAQNLIAGRRHRGRAGQLDRHARAVVRHVHGPVVAFRRDRQPGDLYDAVAYGGSGDGGAPGDGCQLQPRRDQRGARAAPAAPAGADASGAAARSAKDARAAAAAPSAAEPRRVTASAAGGEPAVAAAGATAARTRPAAAVPRIGRRAAAASRATGEERTVPSGASPASRDHDRLAADDNTAGPAAATAVTVRDCRGTFSSPPAGACRGDSPPAAVTGDVQVHALAAPAHIERQHLPRSHREPPGDLGTVPAVLASGNHSRGKGPATVTAEDFHLRGVGTFGNGSLLRPARVPERLSRRQRRHRGSCRLGGRRDGRPQDPWPPPWRRPRGPARLAAGRRPS